MLEKGLFQRLRKFWHYKRPQCPEGHNSIPTAVSMPEFSPVLVMLVAGYVVAASVMITEYLFNKFNLGPAIFHHLKKKI